MIEEIDRGMAPRKDNRRIDHFRAMGYANSDIRRAVATLIKVMRTKVRGLIPAQEEVLLVIESSPSRHCSSRSDVVLCF
ncbi:hypothetical protein EJB05_44346, partial [Eragrostis curvula]